MSAPAADALVSARGLTRRFGTFVAVRNIDVDLPRGRVFGFLGPNGSGKSTTIRMLAGLLAPSEGRITGFGGLDLAADTDGWKRRLGYMSQKFSLYLDLTVEENLRFFGSVYGLRGAALASRIDALSDRLRFGATRSILTASLSTGLRQRVALAAALLHEPELLFLDEPTGGVDPLSRRRFWRLIDELSQAGVAVLVTTHYLDEAEHCHRVAIIQAGKLAALGTVEELKSIFASRPIFEVLAARPVDAMQVLDAMPEVEKTSIFGTAVHAVMRSPDAKAEALAGRLRTAGQDVTSVMRVPPSLEDVFLDVAEKGAA
jgi:ABC-2 type transport system ATP-binding protein